VTAAEPAFAATGRPTERLRWIRRGVLVGAAIGAVYAVWFLLVPPSGNFPLNDDWAYAWSVRRLLDTGQLRISAWASATSLFPIYWGALFSRLAGAFSFAALRWSTLTMSVVGCVAVYDLLRQSDIPVRSACLGAVAVAANPIYLYLSYTFMSDVFYFAPMVVSLGLYIRGIRRNSASALVGGSVAAAAAYLARQLAIALPIAAAFALVQRDRRLRWPPVIQVALVPGLVFVGHSLWLNYVHGLPWGLELNAVHNSIAGLLQPLKPLEIAWRLLISMLYVGLFTLPALAALIASPPQDPKRRPRLTKLFVIWFAGLMAVVALSVFVTHGPMPYLGNVINRAGIGPITLAGQKPLVTAGWVFWLVTAVAPLAGAAQGALWTDAVLKVRQPNSSEPHILVIASLVMAVLAALVVILWDEYLIVFMPAGLYLVLRLRPITRLGLVAGGGVCALMLAYGCREMSDYMAWNAARWTAGQRLVAQGVRPEAIDGGFEWAGWYEFESALPVAIANGKGADLFGWMTVNRHDFRLAFSPAAGYEVRGSVPYRGSPLAFVPAGRIYLLEAVVK
jgi:hypothetical protein